MRSTSAFHAREPAACCSVQAAGARQPRKRGDSASRPASASATQGERAVLGRVERAHVELAQVLRREKRARPGGEVPQARADREHEVGARGEPVRRGRAGDADRARVARMVPGEAPLPACVSATGNPCPRRTPPGRFSARAYFTPPPAMMSGRLGSCSRPTAAAAGAVRQRPLDEVHAAAKKDSG